MHGLRSRIEKLNNLYIGTILFFTTLFTYFNTLGNGLLYDDEHFIYNNVYVRAFSFVDFFTNSTTSGGGGGVSNYYRPILSMLFSLQYQLFGNNGFVYHLTSIFLHAGCAILLFLILKKLFNQTVPSLIAALFFIVHPVQTEAIAYASGQGDPLSLLLLLLSIMAVLQKKIKTAIIFLSATLLSKETGLMAPGFIALIMLTQQKDISFHSLKRVLLKSLPFWTLSVLYFIARLTVLNFSNTLNFYRSANMYTDNIGVRLNTFLHVLPSYALLLIKPFPLFIDRNIPFYTTIDLTAIIVVAILLSAICCAFYFFKPYPVIFFSVCWFFLGFIPSSGIFIPINGIMYEHFLYYPSIGIFTGVAFVVNFLLLKKPFVSIPAAIGLAVLFLYFGIITIQRNADWHDPVTFYTQTLRHTESARIRNNLAMAYADSGDLKKSIEQYKKAIAVGDFYPQTHFNLGNAYLSLNQPSAAEQEYLKAIKLDPTFDRPYISLTNLYKETGQNEKLHTWLQSVETLAKKNNNFIPLYQYLKSLIK